MAIVNYILKPMKFGIKFSKMNCPKLISDQGKMISYPYFQVVGNLMCAIMNSRLEYAFTINNLAQYMSNLDISHWQGIK
jgi:hypothetical protein